MAKATKRPARRPATAVAFSPTPRRQSWPADDHRRLIEDGADNEGLTAAAAYWQLWPTVLGVISTQAADDEDKHVARHALADTHHAAELRLMAECVRAGIEPGPLAEEGRYCRERIIAGDIVTGWGNAYGAWPDLLGQRRYELPAIVQAAIVAGEATFRTLCVKLDMSTTAARDSKIGRSIEQRGRHRTDEQIEADKELATKYQRDRLLFISDKAMAEDEGMNESTFRTQVDRGAKELGYIPDTFRQLIAEGKEPEKSGVKSAAN